jgi:hypothetical protein
MDAQVSHQCFPQAHKFVEDHGEGCFMKFVGDIQAALDHLYGDKHVSTFRRGDLIQKLLALPL